MLRPDDDELRDRPDDKPGDDHRWRLVERRTVHEGRFVRLYQDYLTGPAAPEFYEHVGLADAVRVVALDEEGGVVLAEDEFYLPGHRMLHLPGGGVEPGEDPAVAARRELAEETGWRADSVESLGSIHPFPSVTAARTHLFLARGLRAGAAEREAAEQWMTVHRVPLAEAVALVRSGVITEAGSVAALLLAAQQQEPA